MASIHVFWNRMGFPPRARGVTRVVRRPHPGYREQMSNGWFSQRRRPVGEVNWGRHVREDAERADQVLYALIAINILVFVVWTQSFGSSLQILMERHFV